MDIRRFDIFYVKLPEEPGSVQRGVRPVLVVQGNAGNSSSGTTIVVPMTSKPKKHIPTHVEIPFKIKNVSGVSLLLCEQIRTIDTSTLTSKIGKVTDPAICKKIDRALKVSLGLETSSLDKR